MIIKILGGGCSNCIKLAANTKEALESLGIEAEIVKVTDIQEIIPYGVMSTPALVIDEKVIFSGKVAKVKEIVKILKGLNEG